MTRDDTERLDLIERRLARIERVLSELYRDRSRGYVYVITDGHGRYKIGVAVDVDERLKSLSTGGTTYILALTIETDDRYALEKALHTIYRGANRHIIREWYALAQPDIDALNNLLQPFFVESLPTALNGVDTGARLPIERPLATNNGTHPTVATARSLVSTTEAARAAALFIAGSPPAEIVKELRGVDSNAGRRYQAALNEVLDLIRQGVQGRA